MEDSLVNNVHKKTGKRPLTWPSNNNRTLTWPYNHDNMTTNSIEKHCFLVESKINCNN